MTEITPELLATIRKRYTAPAIPQCRVCGGELSLGSIGGGFSTYACSSTEENPHYPGQQRYKENRTLVDEHYVRSRHVQYESGDEDVLALVSAYERLISDKHAPI